MKSTSTFETLQDLIDKLKSGSLPITDVSKLLLHRSPLIRVNALNALVMHAASDADTISQITKSAIDQSNSICLMGKTSVAHVAVGCLFQIGTPSSICAAEGLLEAWPDPDRSDLLYYLESEGLRKAN